MRHVQTGGEQTEVLVASDAGDYRQLPLSGNVMGEQSWQCGTKMLPLLMQMY
jgi:hypothetical protein